MTDDLEFFLLDIVVETTHRLTIFSHDDLGMALNVRVPAHDRDELIAALLRLSESGDIEIISSDGQWQSRRPIQPDEDILDAGLAGAIPHLYRLTPSGGERWKALTGMEWDQWTGDQWTDSENHGQITTASRELTEFVFERERRQRRACGKGRWTEVRPWKPVYWHEEPVGYRVRYRAVMEEEMTVESVFRWGWLSRNDRPPSLAMRKSAPLADRRRPLERESDQALWRRLDRASVLDRFAAAVEIGCREGTTRPWLKRLARRRCPSIQHAAARAIGRFATRDDVPDLIAALLRGDGVVAADALGRIGDPRALGPLMVVFEWCGEAPVIASVGRAIGQFGEEGVRELERLTERRPDLGERIESALSRSNSEWSADVLLKHLDRQGGRAYRIMPMLAGMPHGREHLLAIAKNRDEDIHFRWEAARALSEIEGAHGDEARRIHESLQRDRRHSALRWRYRALVPNAAPDALSIPELVEALRSPAPETRIGAIELLFELNAREAADEIAQLCGDDSWQVRVTVARVLIRWGEPAWAIKELQQDTDVNVRGYARWRWPHFWITRYDSPL